MKYRNIKWYNLKNTFNTYNLKNTYNTVEGKEECLLDQTGNADHAPVILRITIDAKD